MDENFNKGQLLIRIYATVRFLLLTVFLVPTITIADCFHLFESVFYFTQLRNNQLNDNKNL